MSQNTHSPPHQEQKSIASFCRRNAPPLPDSRGTLSCGVMCQMPVCHIHLTSMDLAQYPAEADERKVLYLKQLTERFGLLTGRGWLV